MVRMNPDVVVLYVFNLNNFPYFSVLGMNFVYRIRMRRYSIVFGCC